MTEVSMQTRWATSICLLSALFILIGGCVQKSDKDKTTIVFSYGAEDKTKEQLYDELIEKFTAANPTINVFRHPIAGVSNTDRVFYLTSFKSKSTFVDIFDMDVIWTAEFAAGNLIKPLQDSIPADLLDHFIPQSIAAASYGGKLHALPYYNVYGGLFYRTDLLKKYDFSPPTSWEELIKQAKEIGQKEGIDGFVWQAKKYEGLTCNFLEFYFNQGGEIQVVQDKIIFDQAVLVNTLKSMQDLVESGVTPTSVLSADEGDSLEEFKDGQAVFMRNWHSVAGNIAEGEIGNNFAIASMPGKGISLVGAANLAINANSSHSKEALQFALFLVEHKNQIQMAKKGLQSPVLAELDQPQLAKNIRYRPKSPYYHFLSVMLIEVVHQVLENELTPTEAANQIIDKAKKLAIPKKAEPGFPEQLKLRKWY
jgi:multiple sugar transport system substrate-binding protein